MYTVYVLQDSQGKFYKGMTNNLARRLAEHRGSATKTTRPWIGSRLCIRKNFLIGYLLEEERNTSNLLQEEGFYKRFLNTGA